MFNFVAFWQHGPRNAPGSGANFDGVGQVTLYPNARLIKNLTNFDKSLNCQMVSFEPASYASSKGNQPRLGTQWGASGEQEKMTISQFNRNAFLSCKIVNH